jgi:hypothetical protein
VLGDSLGAAVGKTLGDALGATLGEVLGAAVSPGIVGDDVGEVDGEIVHGRFVHTGC